VAAVEVQVREVEVVAGGRLVALHARHLAPVDAREGVVEVDAHAAVLPSRTRIVGPGSAPL
jgi:hypothetical protein